MLERALTLRQNLLNVLENETSNYPGPDLDGVPSRTYEMVHIARPAMFIQSLQQVLMN